MDSAASSATISLYNMTLLLAEEDTLLRPVLIGVNPLDFNQKFPIS